jgi:DNA-binding transcriptional MocR family regulator
VAIESVPASAGGRAGDRPAVRIDFGYGRTDVSSFPRAAWLRSVRTVLTTTPTERFAYLDGRGVPELHEALTDYLNRVRGTSARPENAARRGLIVQGVAQYRLSPVGPGGLIFGYATLTERAIVDGVGVLADAVADIRSPQR